MSESTYSGPLGGHSPRRERQDSSANAATASQGADAAGSGQEGGGQGTGIYQGEDLAAALLTRVFQRLPGSLTVRLWSGAPFAVGAETGRAASDPRFVLVFRNPEVVCTMVLGRDPLRLAEAYFRGDVDIEGDLFAALRLKDHLESMQLPMRDRISAALGAFRLRALNQQAQRSAGEAAPQHGPHVRGHSRDENRDAIEFHYDVSNEFYRLWLDRAMVYSCAYFERADMSLDDAQQAKLEHICRKLMLRPEERFLDVGCGWGTLVIYAAQHFGVHAHGITLSEKQLSVARQRIAEAGLEDRVIVELKDYRDLGADSAYDKVASIGMFEHVGLKKLPLYFSTLRRVLKPDGLLLNHGITHAQFSWDKIPSTQFINRYVFPDGQLDNISNIENVMERAGFEIADVESLRPHYALTLRAWVDRLERRHARALEYVSEATYRVWRLYMAGSRLGFERNQIQLHQILAVKLGEDGRSGMPLRPHWEPAREFTAEGL